jgi:seryl-tRNA synthetase
MSPHSQTIDRLTARGDLWTPAPGLTGLRGAALRRFRAIEERIRTLCADDATEWLVPPALPLHVLERAGYFASFPQWLSVASHLSDDPISLERVAHSEMPSREVGGALAAPSAALPPAVCYHVYAALADHRLDRAHYITAQGCCWRHEGAQLAALERNWAFTMREVVCIGSEKDCEQFVKRGLALVQRLAETLTVPFTVDAAEDPFYAPTARGRALLQRVKGLKQEIRLPLAAGHTVAAASINLHERFFGEAFDIRAADGSPAFTACVAFGLERWLLAALTLDEEAAGEAALLVEATR